MITIVNVNKEYGIGKNGDLLVYIPEDMKFFRTVTKNSIVIMGRKTLESFPEGRPLKGRANIVITRSKDLYSKNEYSTDNVSGVIGETLLYKVASIEEAITLSDKIVKAREEYLSSTQSYQSDDSMSIEHATDVYVIGGASIYKAMLKYCDTLLLTVNSCEEKADMFFPNIEELPEWKLVSESEAKECEGITFTFRKYKKC